MWAMSYPPKIKRNQQLYNYWLAYRDDSLTLRAIGERFPKPDGKPLSRERVRQIIRMMEAKQSHTPEPAGTAAGL